MSLNLKRLSARDIKAALAAIDKDPALSANAKAVTRMRLLQGEERMSRRGFIEHALRIEQRQTLDFGVWTLNGSQRYVDSIRLKTVRAGKLERYAVLKARKRGISTLFLGYAFERMLRVNHFKSAIVAEKKDSARELLKAGKLMCENLPVKLATKFSNVNEIYFDSPLNSQIRLASAEEKEPLRGATLRMVHCTEPQLWDDAQEKRTAIELCVAGVPGTMISYEGTGAGRNWWYDFWWAAQRGENEFVAIFLSWLRDRTWDAATEISGEEAEELATTLSHKEQRLRMLGATYRQLKWRRNTIASRFGGKPGDKRSWVEAEKAFEVEFPATPEEAFSAEGRPAFIQNNIDRAQEDCTNPIWQGDVAVGDIEADDRGVQYTLLEDTEGALKIWTHPIAGHDYAMGIDVGHGVGEDNSVIDVIDNITGEQVAVLAIDNAEPRPFGRMVAAVGQLYLNAYALVEIEGPGRDVIYALKDVRYQNIGTRDVWDSRRQRVVGQKLGWSTNTATRDMLFNELRESIAGPKGTSGIRDRELCLEMGAMYRDEEDKEQSPKGKVNDRVTARSISLVARRQSRRSEPDEVVPWLPAGSIEERHWRDFRDQVREARHGITAGMEPEEEGEWM